MRNEITCSKSAMAWLLVSMFASNPSLQAEVDIRRDATVEAVAKTRPSVVNISTARIVEVRDEFDDFFGRFFFPQLQRRPPHLEAVPYSLGSGVIIDEDGFILTNFHVVQKADKIAVVVGTNLYDARIEAGSPTSDIALLKIEPREKLQPIKFAKDDDLLLGETVIAVGNPFGLGLSISRGILSSTARRPQPEKGPLGYQDWLQTDTAINQGNSGGPLINLRGELIGINVAVLREVREQSAEGIGFAIPVKRVGEALSEIFTPENKGFWFGAKIKSSPGQLGITSVQPGSPAEKAGLRQGDRILKIGGKTPKNFIEFMVELIKLSETGDVPLSYARNGAQREARLRIVKETTVFNANLIQQKTGITLQELTPELAEVLGVNPESGLVMAMIERNSPAAFSGLQPGFVLTGINGEPVKDVVSAAKVLYERKKGETVSLDLLVVQRRGNFGFLTQGKADLRLR